MTNEQDWVRWVQNAESVIAYNESGSVGMVGHVTMLCIDPPTIEITAGDGTKDWYPANQVTSAFEEPVAMPPPLEWHPTDPGPMSSYPFHMECQLCVEPLHVFGESIASIAHTMQHHHADQHGGAHPEWRGIDNCQHPECTVSAVVGLDVYEEATAASVAYGAAHHRFWAAVRAIEEKNRQHRIQTDG